MKKYILSIFLIALISTFSFAQESSELFNKLNSLKNISDITKLDNHSKLEKYQVFITQNIDPQNPSVGTFKQRLIIIFRGFDKPTVLVTEGYRADYATNPNYKEELSEMYGGNVICCEHRYFSQSVPKDCNWDYMTIANSTVDLHNIRQTFSDIFKGKWISTGISKGGSTCIYYRAAFPNDVDVSVAYVAPISRALEDGRHEKFLNKKVGSKEDRKNMRDIQLEFMRRKPQLLKPFEDYCEDQNYKFSLPIADIFDYEVLELEFSMWQWGIPISSVPKKYDSDADWLTFLVQNVEPDYFVYPNDFTPFYYQAVKEFGYYGYDIKHLGKNRSLTSTKNYLKQIMLPQDMKDIEFDPTMYKNTCKYLKKNDPTMIFLYGQNDPWTASGVAPWLNCKKKQNMKVYVNPNGSHLTRISNLPSDMRDDVVKKLKSWGIN